MGPQRSTREADVLSPHVSGGQVATSPTSNDSEEMEKTRRISFVALVIARQQLGIPQNHQMDGLGRRVSGFNVADEGVEQFQASLAGLC